ncbi:MAG TPA: hypothetical protein VGO50_16310 [Pyrinomonadaceae bacterium]|jgi:hypothetical protein|nr:hypothetical protein [Pyrinomonadaceae bacterium]
MKTLTAMCFLIFVSLTTAIAVNGQNANGCTSGVRNGIFYTDCWTRGSDPDDTIRLRNAINAAYGKLIFNEGNYYISGALPLHPYIVIEGTGKASSTSWTAVSKIVQNTANTAIFTIGEGQYEITIRDLALVGNNSGTIGIKAEGGSGTNASSLHFLFSNLRFAFLSKGIYVNATNQVWQCDQVKLEQASFENCTIGVHINSNNSGWDISSIEFLVPRDGIGIYMERGTYTSMNLLIGNGPEDTHFADALVRVRSHANLSIKNSVAERFNYDLVVEGTPYSDRTEPIYLFNNHFFSGLSVRDTTLISSGNQFGTGYDNLHGWSNIDVIAKGYSQITSLGDKFCPEGYIDPLPPYASCENKNWELQDGAQLVFSTNNFKNTTSVPTIMSRDGYDGIPLLSLMPKTFTGTSLLRLGKGNVADGHYFDITRSEADGTLTFTSNEGYGYTFNGNGGAVGLTNSNLKFNTSGKTITLGSTTQSGLGSPANGTLFYCSDCTATAACNSGGSGAIAKRINSAWVCN